MFREDLRRLFLHASILVDPEYPLRSQLAPPSGPESSPARSTPFSLGLISPVRFHPLKCPRESD